MITIRARESSGDLFVDAESIASIEPASASSRWHGYCSIVRMKDGRVIESADEASTIAAKKAEYLRGLQTPNTDAIEVFSVIASGVEAGYHRWVLAALQAHFAGEPIPAPVRDVVTAG